MATSIREAPGVRGPAVLSWAARRRRRAATWVWNMERGPLALHCCAP
ncbi:hypothetical protein [Nocardia pneumoniae]|nr:hypothetical protein [Nocardia pneumoniae]